MDSSHSSETITVKKLKENEIHFEIKGGNSVKTIIDRGDLNDELFAQIVTAQVQTACRSGELRDICNMKSTLTRYYASLDKQKIWGQCVAKSQFHIFVCKSIEQFKSRNNPTEYEWNRIKTICNTCVSASDKSAEFCINIRGSILYQLLLQDIIHFNYEDENENFLVECALLILHNTFRYADEFQNELFASKDLKRALVKFLNYPDEGVQMAAFLILAIAGDVKQLDKQPDTAELIMEYIKRAWMSNDRRCSGCHLEELLSGLYYALKSDEVKRRILNETNMEVFCEIVELLENPTEVMASLTIIKQIAKSPEMKQILKNEFNIIPFLKSLHKEKMPAVISIINNLIEEFNTN